MPTRYPVETAPGIQISFTGPVTEIEREATIENVEPFEVTDTEGLPKAPDPSDIPDAVEYLRLMQAWDDAYDRAPMVRTGFILNIYDDKRRTGYTPLIRNEQAEALMKEAGGLSDPTQLIGQKVLAYCQRTDEMPEEKAFIVAISLAEP